MSGQLDEAEKFAARAIRILEENYSPDDPVFLRPFAILASARFERGEVGRAREAFKRMRTIRIEREERALMRGLSAMLLSAEGRYREAESESLLALQSWEQAGRGEMADAGTVLAIARTGEDNGRCPAPNWRERRPGRPEHRPESE
jgi:hypothetical protein